MQHFFMCTSAILAIILIYSLRVNGRKLKDLEQELGKLEQELGEKENGIKVRYEEREKYRVKFYYLERKSNELKKQNEELAKRIKGERVCDGYCKSCTNAVEYQGRISCKLDCKCRDFNAKEQTNERNSIQGTES